MNSSLNHRLFLVIVIFVSVNFREAFAGGTCGCQSHPQDRVCDAQFVIKAKILSKSVIDMTRLPHGTKETAYYKIHIYTVFKGVDIISSSNKEIATTNSAASVPCGYPDFEIGEKYILTGSQDFDGNLWTEDCQWNEKWDDLREQQKQGLMYEAYIENCDCTISTEDVIPLNDIYPQKLSTIKSHLLRKIQAQEATSGLHGRYNKRRYSDDVCALDVSDKTLISKMSCVRGCRNQLSCSWVRNEDYKDCLGANHDTSFIHFEEQR